MLKSTILSLFCLLLFGCGNHSATPNAPSNSQIRVLATTAMIDDLVSQIGKERIAHSTLIFGEMDPHSYELVKGDDEKIGLAQIVFYNGLGLEHGASLKYQLEHHPRSVALGDEVLKNYPERILKKGPQIDPHIWIDLSVWALTIDPIVDALSKIDPEGKSFYEENGSALKKQILKAHQEIFDNMQKIPSEKRFLITTHDAFNYFARAYLANSDEKDWQKRFRAPEGLAPDGQLSVSDIQRIIDHLCAHRIEVVFPESNLSKDSLKKIVSACKEKGLSVKISKKTLYGDAMGPPGSDGDSYLKMMQHNALVLMQEWEINE